MKLLLLMPTLLAFGFTLTGCQTSTTPKNHPPVGSDFLLQVYSTGQIPGIYPGLTTKLSISVLAAKDYVGPVQLTALDLPQGVTAQPKTVELTGNGSSVITTLTLNADDNSPIAGKTFSVIAKNKTSEVIDKVDIIVYPKSVQVPGTRAFIELDSKSVDPKNNLWLGGSTGFLKITPNLDIDIVSSTPPDCGTVMVGQDGGIWARAIPYMRLDPTKKQIERYPSPRGGSGCASHPVDAKGHVWDNLYGLYQLDLLNQKTKIVPGTENLGGTVVIQDGYAWFSARDELYVVDVDSLATRQYTVPGVSFFSGSFVSNGKVYFVNEQHLSLFNPESETINQINSGKWRISKLYGLDKYGNAWVSGNDSTDKFHPALLRIDSRGKVLKELPDFSGTFSATADGGLWYATHEYEDPRVAYIAP